MLFTDRGGVYKRNVESQGAKENPPAGFNTNPTEKVSRPMKDQALMAPNCWVKKWVDYSSKYGLGYLLSN